MALNAGDMLYYDGTKWVNSSTIVTAAPLILEVSDAGTSNIPYALQLTHVTSNPGGIIAGYGVGLQFNGLQTDGTPREFGNIQCVEVGPAAGGLASYLSFNMWNLNIEAEILRLRPVGPSPGQVWCRGDFLHAGTNLAFFNATPTTQQAGGAATAGATYGANEQSMLQKAYNCLRTFGLLS